MSCGCRPNKHYAERYRMIVEAIDRLKVTSIVIDGEAMCFTGAAHDFDKLWNRTHDHEAKLCAFDCWNSMVRTIARSRLLTGRDSYSSYCAGHGTGLNTSNT